MAKEKIIPQCGTDCKLCEGVKTPFMPISGNIDSNLLFVGESPGAEEDIEGVPFIGRAGKLLRTVLKENGIENFAITNVCRCRPPNNRVPDKKEIEACLPRLMEDIGKMPNLKLIVPLGNVALQALTGMKSITKVSGKVFPYGSIKLMPIYHPAYILRNQKESKNFREHIRRIISALDDSDSSDFGEYKIIENFEEWTRVFLELKHIGFFIYDTETTGLNPFVEGFQVKCIGFSIKDHQAWVLSLYNNRTDFEPWDKVYDDLKQLFTSKRIGKVGHNLKFDNKVIQATFGWEVRGSIWDTAIVSHLLDENKPHSLKDLAWEISGCGGYERALPDTPDKVDGEVLFKYNGCDCDMTTRLYNIQKIEIAQDGGLVKLNQNLIIPVANVLAKMEMVGIRIDQGQLKECSKAAEEYVAKIIEQIYREQSVIDFEKAAEVEFNPNSHVQLREVLFKYEGLEPIKMTEKAKAPSTDRETLDILANRSNLCRLLSEYSMYSAIQSKSIEELKYYLTKEGRIHTTFSLDITATGRSSSLSPNLQNVPKGKKDVVGIRKAFVPDNDFLFAEFDFNQWELRCMAEEAGDFALMEALNGDVHRATAAAVLNKRPEDITDEERRNTGKTVNFGLIYLLSAFGLAQRLKITEEEAKIYINRFFTKYYKTYEWMKWAEDFIKKNHYIKSKTGRYRRFPVWDEMSPKLIREGTNMPIQSLAGDALLYGLIGIDEFLVKNKCKSFLTLEIHDSVLINLHKEEMGMLPEVKYIMENYFKKFVEFGSTVKVDIKLGENWKEMEEVQ